MDDERYESDEPFTDSLVDSIFGDGIAVAVERCPLCLRSRRPFYCKDCVNAGNFSRNSNKSERYSDLEQKLVSLSSKRTKFVDQVGQKIAAKEVSAAKRDEIEDLKIRIRLLKWSIKEATRKKEIAENFYTKQRENNKQNARKLQKSHASIPKTRVRYNESLEQSQKKVKALEERNLALRDERCRVVDELTDFIFPVVELTALGNTSYSLCLETSSLFMSTARQLSEACQLAYMSGQWVHTDRYGNTLIKIVESTLPGNGVYSAGVTSDSQELASFAEDRQHFASTNPRWKIISGLCHTAQLEQILSCVLYVILPRKLAYSTFGFKDFNEKQLNQAVGQLNHNMLHLCFSQGVPPSRMISRHTMHNLLLLLRSEHLGREQPFDDNERMVEAVNDGCESEEDSDEDEMEPPQDWDFVFRGDLPEMQVPVHASVSWSYNPATYAGHMLSGTQSTASDLVTSAAASVASFWRTATGGRTGNS
ncbi:beclin 1-associated autophagy-related key regulator-like [Littorina saxatilis]|uniref:Beclin 1-associated autophagy-related key regulator n=1 Tax=Littorina saxatilis TaxID=31220 RepID=A0AAN9GE97_9CAEN